jgi:ammonium transporter Rh
MAFASSSLLSEERRFRIVDLRNATLSGAVAIGSIANLALHPAVALIVGMLAGFISAVGSQKMQHYIENKHNIHDTCGINNLHGMPSIIGGVASIIVTATMTSLGNQWFWQLCALVVTLFFASCSGLLTGKVLKYYESRNQDKFSDFDESDWIATDTTSEIPESMIDKA